MSATGKVVGEALANSRQFIKEGLVRISDVGTSLPVRMCGNTSEVGDGATPILSWK